MKEHFLQMKVQCSFVIDYNYGFGDLFYFIFFLNSEINSIQLAGHWLFVTVVHIKCTVTSSYMNTSCLAVPWRPEGFQYIWNVNGNPACLSQSRLLLCISSHVILADFSILYIEPQCFTSSQEHHLSNPPGHPPSGYCIPWRVSFSAQAVFSSLGHTAEGLHCKS